MMHCIKPYSYPCSYKKASHNNNFTAIYASMYVLRGIGRGGSKGSDKAPFKPGFFISYSSLNTSITYSIDWMCIMENPHPHVMLIKFPAPVKLFMTTTHDAQHSGYLWGVNLFVWEYVTASYVVNIIVISCWRSLSWRAHGIHQV